MMDDDSKWKCGLQGGRAEVVQRQGQPPRVSCLAQDLVEDPAQQGMDGRPSPALAAAQRYRPNLKC